MGWGAIAVVLAAGLTGLFGGDALALASVSSVDGGAIAHYERIVRHGALSRIELRLAPAAAGDSTVVVSIDEEYLRDMDLQRVAPAPLRVRASSGRVEFHLLRLDPAQPMTVVLSLQPGAAGSRRAALRTNHGVLDLRQLVLP